MSLVNTINSAVDIAFSTLGDLVTTATLSNASNESYAFPVLDPFGNPTTEGAVSTTTVSSTVQVIIESSGKVKSPEGLDIIQTQMLIRSDEIPNPSVYSSVTVGTKVYTIVSYTADVALTTLFVTEL